MDPLKSFAPFLNTSNPSLWAGVSATLAIFLLVTQFRRMLRLRWMAAARRRSKAREVVEPRWMPTLTAGDRRRRFRRGGNPVPVLVVGLDGNRRFDGRVLDRSQGGLRIEATEPARTGTTLLVRSCQAPPGSPWVPVSVRWCREKQGRIEFGCQFTNELSLPTMATFG
jgi:hypothetical protein